MYITLKAPERLAVGLFHYSYFEFLRGENNRGLAFSQLHKVYLFELFEGADAILLGQGVLAFKVVILDVY